MLGCDLGGEQALVGTGCTKLPLFLRAEKLKGNIHLLVGVQYKLSFQL